MEGLYVRASRERFMPFVRACLIISFVIELFELVTNYVATGEVYFLDLRLALIVFYTVLLGATYIPGAVHIIHIIGIAGITGVIYSLAFLAAQLGTDFERFIPVFFIPLQLIPVITSFIAAFVTLGTSVHIIIDFAEKSGMSEAGMSSLKNTLMYYVLVSAAISYVATQYRRASFKMEKNLEQARRDAETANEAKSTFLATMSHEVRTPLNGILGVVTLLRDSRLDPQQQDYIETIKYSGETLLTILNDILDFSKMEAGKFDIEEVVFNVERLVESVVTLMKSRAQEKNLDFDYKISTGVPSHIKSDPTRIRQVLLNLISNGIKFTDRGFVHVLVSCEAKSEGDATLIFEVSDTGTGISQEGQKNLFRKFAQADSSISRKYGGTGLGLAICKQIVELMKGRIGVRSEEGKGSTFWFEIPAEIAQKAQIDTAGLGHGEKLSETLPALSALHVLVAEDNKINQKVITGLLERGGHKATTVENGEAAVEILSKDENNFDLVLMDMQMPVMDGLSATQGIRALAGKNSDLPIIALTANTVRGDEQRCLAAGMNGFVTKPIDPAALFQAMARHAGENQNREQETPDQDQDTQESPRADKPEFVNLVKIENMLGRDYVQKFAEDGILETGELIDTICNSNDNQEIKSAAHNLKSLSNMFGLKDVEAIAEGIEMCCSDNRTEEAVVLAGLLEERYKGDIKHLRENYLIKF